MRSFSEFDDDGDGRRVRLPPWAHKALSSLSRCRNRVATALPPTMLVESDLLLRHRTKQAWGSCITWFTVVALVAVAAFLVSAIVVVSRTWADQCNVPLGPFIIVALLLCVPLLVILLVLSFTFTVALKIAALIACAATASWGFVGIAWLATADSACRAALPELFGLTIAFVGVFLLPALVGVIYVALQIAFGMLLRRGYVEGSWLPPLLSGQRQPRNGMLGVVVLGDKGVGKTSLLQALNRCVARVFPPDGKAKVINESPVRFSLKANRITFNEEDPTQTPLRVTDLVNADCVVLAFSMADRRSFHSIKRMWYAHAAAHCAVPMLLVGTHGDSVGAPPPSAPISSACGPVHDAACVPSDHASWCLGNVPTSIVLRVMSYLPNADLMRAQLVCKLWYEMGRHPYVWRHRATGSVSRHAVNQWMRSVARDSSHAGAARVAGFVMVNCSRDAPDERALVAAWRRVVSLALLNETKLYLGRTEGGEVVYSRRPLQDAMGVQ